MKTSYKFVLAMVGSAAVGGLAVQALHAQAKLPAYFISEATIKDPDLYRKFLSEEPPNSQFGGRQLVRGGRVIGIEGEPTPPPRGIRKRGSCPEMGAFTGPCGSNEALSSSRRWPDLHC